MTQMEHFLPSIRLCHGPHRQVLCKLGSQKRWARATIRCARHKRRGSTKHGREAKVPPGRGEGESVGFYGSRGLCTNAHTGLRRLRQPARPSARNATSAGVRAGNTYTLRRRDTPVYPVMAKMTLTPSDRRKPVGTRYYVLPCRTERRWLQGGGVKFHLCHSNSCKWLSPSTVRSH